MRVSEAGVLSVLGAVMASIGVPLDIRDMRLGSAVDRANEGSARMSMRLTTPGCLERMTGFSDDVDRRVGAPMSASAEFGGGCSRSEADINEEGRYKLELSRKRSS
jgi:hypothetical protein